MRVSARFRRAGLRLGVALALVCGAGFASAGGIAQLRQFIDGARTAQGEFDQTVFAASGRKPQRASGSFVFARPGKFRWTYEKPYPQVLVSDGEKLWSWDRDLNQVTVKRLGDALGSTPAAILAGDGAIERNFELSEAGSGDGLEWVHAKPKLAESSFESMRMGFAGGTLKRMELKDNFGQTTLIEFRSLTAGARPDPAQFRFVPPPGADVIGN
ncbi:outer membrane lipoprotein chaperone LolA [Aromatoleum toluvorans]|uniref:Outer-membrane lipoprotein carrier protein n=1 Tax=Aromatoleum toluvorans TaxID=92002 RepID=A0ABX1PZL0_9RHOO|nr:outer membrane lipoprotein chaperone LolA [Aromatoleum toluvorans]NMG44558.1 outer membrane lipoprotein chaperone LolA [Aromatoleum toluvorans]